MWLNHSTAHDFVINRDNIYNHANVNIHLKMSTPMYVVSLECIISLTKRFYGTGIILSDINIFEV